jgi:glycosyltransferase involved in cell wall biosynthesis
MTDKEPDDSRIPEVSVVMPCLNEEKTIGLCVQKARKAIREKGINGEIVVCDNGSDDRSVEIASREGARVVSESIRGYGSAYHSGIASSRGKIIVIGDADNTYDFSELDRFVQPLRNGYDLVMGSRLKGNILDGAMPWLHRYIGNPFLSGFLNLLFHTGVSDSHCGMRAFTRDAYNKMDLQTTGMEYASEMVIKASKAGLKITEVPITYYPRAGESKLQSFSDGWRHLRFMLLYSPNHLFLVPGMILLIVGIFLLVLLLPGPVTFGHHTYDYHFMFLGCLLALMGFSIINLGLYAKAYSYTEKFEKKDEFIEKFYEKFSLEKGIYLGGIIFLIGFLIYLYVLLKWILVAFGPLEEIRASIFALTFCAIGIETIFSSFLLSMMRITRKTN